MSFSLNEEQRAFRDMMRGFVDEQVAPNAEHYDREQSFPQKSFDACVKMELPSLQVPAEYGGAGADMVTQAIMAEEVSRGCASSGVTVLISKLGMLPVMNFASGSIGKQTRQASKTARRNVVSILYPRSCSSRAVRSSGMLAPVSVVRIATVGLKWTILPISDPRQCSTIIPGLASGSSASHAVQFFEGSPTFDSAC